MIFDIKKYLAENRIALNEDPKDFPIDHIQKFVPGSRGTLIYDIWFGNLSRQAARDFRETKDWHQWSTNASSVQFEVNISARKRFESLIKTYYPRASIRSKEHKTSAHYIQRRGGR